MSPIVCPSSPPSPQLRTPLSFNRLPPSLQRVICRPDMVGEPSVEGWHRDGVIRLAIACIARQGIDGGTNQFKLQLQPCSGGEGGGGGGDQHQQPVPESVLELDLAPGQMVVFDDAPVRHRVTPIRAAQGYAVGHRDVVLFAYGGVLTP